MFLCHRDYKIHVHGVIYGRKKIQMKLQKLDEPESTLRSPAIYAAKYLVWDGAVRHR